MVVEAYSDEVTHVVCAVDSQGNARCAIDDAGPSNVWP